MPPGKMIPECLAIILIVLLLMIDLFRRGRKAYAKCIIPLFILPSVHILTMYLSAKVTPVHVNMLIIITHIVSALLTILLISLNQKGLGSKRNKVMFFISCTAYTCVLTTILILVSLI